MYNYIQRFYLTTQLTKSVTERACFSAAHSRQNFKIIVRTQTQSRDLSELKVLGIFTIPHKYTCGSALGWHARGRGGRGAGESPGGLALPARGSELASPSRTGGLFASWSQKVQVVAEFDLRSLVGIGFPSAILDFDAFFCFGAFGRPYLGDECDSGVRLCIVMFARRFAAGW